MADMTDRTSVPSRVHAKHLFFDCPLTEIETLIVAVRMPELFENFITSLPRDMDIRCSAFVLAHRGHQDTNSALSVIAISDGAQTSSGLGIAIPQEKSMLQEICDTHCLKTITPARDFHGNYVERRALIVSDRKSVV